MPRTELLTPNVLSVQHWDRLRSGALVAATPRLDWATLLRRTFDVDVKQCPKCTGRVRVIAVIDDEATATAILRELGAPPAAPAPKARDPDELFGDPADSYDAC